MSEGIVYLLTNEAMPGYVKIGLTRANDVGQRIRQLDTTAVPMPFECFYAARVPDCAALEKTLHFVFGERRQRRNREFFTIDPYLARAVIELVAIGEVRISDAEQDIRPAERAEIEEHRQRRANRTFTGLNVPVGAVLTFTKDAAVTCTVSGARTVWFEDDEMSPSAAALRAVHAMGYSWKAVSGMDYWAYGGVKLCELGEADEPCTQPPNSDFEA